MAYATERLSLKIDAAVAEVSVVVVRMVDYFVDVRVKVSSAFYLQKIKLGFHVDDSFAGPVDGW